MVFPRQEHWNGWPFPIPWGLPNPRIKPVSLTLQADFFLPSETPGKPLQCYTQKQINVTFYLHAYTYTKLLGEI